MAVYVESSIYLLERGSQWKTEKPYELMFEPPVDFPRKNYQLARHDHIRIEDIRGCEGEFSFKKHGFEILNIETSMISEDFDSPSKIQSQYLGDLGERVKAKLGASRVQVFDYNIRKSHATFPIATGSAYAYSLPATILHIDTTPESTRKMVMRLNSDNFAGLLGGRYQYVNVWKPLCGPVKQWPLLLCDKTTVDPNTDLQERDLVGLDTVLETFLVHPSTSYKFYYISGQLTTEAWIMLQSDSVYGAGVPHCSFSNPSSTLTDPIRESIEVRMIVFYDH